ncbi:hypothetical protein BN85402080 [Alteracholeplasma palmae J233]|uniref:Uncharacterized protein n=1 Tax=Alteracholeplasma palmae (strain ATCC 49389 / J233) TaxID=1318466 RepID=U4KNL1_ALTPJ|nr:hypothetical protein [Alteracholeplasma palmae]CCV63785.1 hypothetical protein BN85402080 [Alteracholeplasma palmae J233]
MFTEKFRYHQGNGMSKRLLLCMMILVTVVQITKLMEVGQFVSNGIIYMVMIIVHACVWMFIGYKFESMEKSLVSHLILFFVMVPDGVKNLFNLITFKAHMRTSDVFYTIILGLIALYAILKIFAHLNEFKYERPLMKENVSKFLLLTLIISYFSFSFSNFIVYLIVSIFIFATLKAKEIFIFIIGIFVVDISSSLTSLFVAGDRSDIIIILSQILSILISCAIIYFSYKYYVNTDIDDRTVDSYWEN